MSNHLVHSKLVCLVFNKFANKFMADSLIWYRYNFCIDFRTPVIRL